MQHAFCCNLLNLAQQICSTVISFVTGFQYSRRNDLPQGTISISNQNLTIVDSSFTNLAAFGQASIILQNSAVVFDNVTFDGNYQSNAGAINVNASSNATILNSVFSNNFGYQAGAIAVGCKPLSLIAFCCKHSFCCVLSLLFTCLTLSHESICCLQGLSQSSFPLLSTPPPLAPRPTQPLPLSMQGCFPCHTFSSCQCSHSILHSGSMLFLPTLYEKPRHE